MTTNTIITDVITSTLEGKGLSTYEVKPYIAPVAEALTERVYDVVELIVEEAANAGLNREEAKSILSRLGLDSRPEPEPEVVEEPAAPQTTDERVEALTGKVEELTAVVSQLADIARNRLGVNL